jgi:sugar transferase (PEP-CTERM/EpsH1 system associated)
MANLLYLAHRLPYPPDKGDKVRSYHLLKHLAKNHRLFLGTFIDDVADEAHVEKLAGLCTSLYVARLRPLVARAASLAALSNGETLTARYYRDRGLQRWVEATCKSGQVDAALAFSSAMAQYIRPRSPVPMLVDFVDVDSAKWSQYADTLTWPLSWLYRRESALLLAFERATAARAERSFFVTESETALFLRLAPECSSRVETLCNGVDSIFFAPDPTRATPFEGAEDRHDPESPSIVFTGAMDYWPNIDAVTWFAQSVVPRLRELRPKLRFYIVGRNPPISLRSLQSDAVAVTGTVADVRPYLQYANVVVAPLRLARGIQNKVLEAMSMGRPVVASATSAEAINARQGVELMTATTSDEFVRQIESLLRNPDQAASMGAAGRRCVLRSYSWEFNLARLDAVLARLPNIGLAA